jgi:hypothetical protein
MSLLRVWVLVVVIWVREGLAGVAVDRIVSVEETRCPSSALRKIMAMKKLKNC